MLLCALHLQRIQELRLKLEGLDKRLVEASKAREARLRKAGAAGRLAGTACIIQSLLLQTATA
jgi:hypothetical protein